MIDRYKIREWKYCLTVVADKMMLEWALQTKGAGFPMKDRHIDFDAIHELLVKTEFQNTCS